MRRPRVEIWIRWNDSSSPASSQFSKKRMRIIVFEAFEYMRVYIYPSKIEWILEYELWWKNFLIVKFNSWLIPHTSYFSYKTLPSFFKKIARGVLGQIFEDFIKASWEMPRLFSKERDDQTWYGDHHGVWDNSSPQWIRQTGWLDRLARWYHPGRGW